MSSPSRRPGPSPLRVAWRALFGGSLIAALVVGLLLSLQPDRSPDPTDLAAGGSETAAPDDGDARERPRGRDRGRRRQRQRAEESTEEPTEEPVERNTEAILGAARVPATTTVQVLDAGGGPQRTQDAVAALTELGYDVVATNPSQLDPFVTTVLATPGNRPEARALRVREPRVVAVDRNTTLSDSVDLHVLVAPDWDR